MRHVSARTTVLALTLCLAPLTACGDAEAPEEGPAAEATSEVGELVTPPFPVRGELEGLMLTWFDGEGTHVAQRRADVPEAHRDAVRVDSLALAPEARDPDAVFVADLRAPGADGAYPVRRSTRLAFEDRVRAARAEAHAAEAAVASQEVVVFGASWCGACRQAEAYLRERGIPFVEHDIEQDPAARADMQRRARAAGITPDGIPIIDVRGHVMQGFDPQAIERALRETTPAPNSPASPTAPPAGGVTI